MPPPKPEFDIDEFEALGKEYLGTRPAIYSSQRALLPLARYLHGAVPRPISPDSIHILPHLRHSALLFRYAIRLRLLVWRKYSSLAFSHRLSIDADTYTKVGDTIDFINQAHPLALVKTELSHPGAGWSLQVNSR